MRTKSIILIIIITSLTMRCNSQNSTKELKGKYFGQTPPGMTPEIFALGIISTEDHEFSITISPDGKSIYFTRRVKEFDRNRIMVTFLTDSGWTKPRIAPIIGDDEGMEPYITNDGMELYFQSWRFAEGQNQPSMDTWKANIDNNQITNPVHLDAPFNPSKSMFISMDDRKTIYTTNIDRQSKIGRIVYSELSNGKYQNYKPVSPNININGTESYPCISKDGSFLIFMKRVDNNAQLYISFKVNNKWTSAEHIDLGLDHASLPSLSKDEKYLFFTSSPKRLKGDIWWVSTKVLEELKPN